jgi:uncharacterized protein YebE (UPF0316 family)
MLTVVLTCLVIIVARIADVSLGTIRTIFVVQGRRKLAFILGFFEILIWVTIVSSVIRQIHEQPVYAVAYAFGFALGNFVGVTIERRLALGRQVVRIITREGYALAHAFRETGLRVTQFDGMGRDGPVHEVFIEAGRHATNKIIAQAREVDPKCYFMVDDVRRASSETQIGEPAGWQAILKRK